MKYFMKLFLCSLCVFFMVGTALADYQKIKIAVLPFNLQGENFETEDMGIIVAEWLITAFVKEGRFEVVERKLLGQILEEQQMVEAGLVSHETASEIGRLLGVKVIISGSVMRLRDIIEVNTRIIDVTSASIVTAESVQSRNVTGLQLLVIQMADKIIKSFPLEGYIANREQFNVIIDLGELAGVKPGMQFMAYKEGEVVRHPKTDEVLYVTQKKTGIIKITTVQRKISEGIIVEETGPDSIEYGDFVKSVHNIVLQSSGQDHRAPVVVEDKKATFQATAIVPEKKQISATSTKKKASARPQTPRLSSELRSYLAKLKGNNSKQRRVAAKKLYKTHPYDALLLKEVNWVLLHGYNSKLSDRNHVDAMAWLCKLLAKSKNIRYKATLQEVINKTQNKKIRKYAEKAIKVF